MTAQLVTPFGRYDRAAVVERAKSLKIGRRSWKGAMRAAYVEARAQLAGLPQAEPVKTESEG